MGSIIIISLCVLLLIAYVFELTSTRTRIPSVIILLLLGWVVRQLTTFFDIQLPDFSSVLPVLGTVGLILIVLEGALELEMNRSRIGIIAKSTIGSLLALLALAFGLAFAFHYFSGHSLKDSMINAIPLCVISSSVAIPSARNLAATDREFIVYESSLSDIFGVLLFNFMALNTIYDLNSFGKFGLELLSITVISFLATIGLSFLLSRIEHHIKFFPIILLVILIYTVSKQYHLPALVFILLFGLFLGNLDELKRFRWIEKFQPDKLEAEVMRFKELVIESTFLVRALFFLLFGYLIETAEILNSQTFIWAAGITAGIFFLRAIQLKLSRLPLSPLLFIAPRGLITVLLFVSVNESMRIPFVNKSLVIQVVLLSALVMMIGLMTVKKPEKPA